MRPLVSIHQENKLFQIFGGEPIKLRWGGWVSDTYLLRREGWDFHAEENYDAYQNCHAIRLAATSPDCGMVISGVYRIRREEFINPYGAMFESWHHRGFEMQQYNARDVFRYVHQDEVNSWRALSPVDITAQSIATERQIVMMDFKCFKPLEGDAQKEIYIPEKNVDDLFNEILKLQYPQQQEIKKGLILPAAKPIVQAKILTLAA